MDEQKHQENIKTIRTYSSDMADAVRQNETSIIKIALAEQQKHEREELYKKAEGTNTSKVLLLLGSIFIVVLALGGIYYVSQKKNIQNTPIQSTKNIDTLISYDTQSFLDMTNATSATDTAGIVQTEIKNNSKASGIHVFFLTHIITEKPELLPLDNFLSLTKITAPGALIRSLDNSYMIGTYKTTDIDSLPHLFLLFKTKDYNQSYAGMLGWENTLLDDLFPLFNIDVSGDKANLFEKKWGDIIINNNDARILLDDNGNPVLYYMFIGKDNFVITDDQATIKEITNRLVAKKIKPL